MRGNRGSLGAGIIMVCHGLLSGVTGVQGMDQGMLCRLHNQIPSSTNSSVLRMRRCLVLPFQCPLNSRTRTDRIKLRVG